MLRDLIAVLDGSPHNDAQLAVAVDLARRTDAHLTGICPLDAMQGIYPSVVVGPYPEMFAFPDAINDFRMRATEKAATMEARFREELRRNGVNGDWEVATGTPSTVVVRRTRSTDLVVLRQTDPDEGGPVRWADLIEDVLMGSGRPVLLVPYAGRFETIGKNVLIGWDGSREATRAAHDMLPLVAPNTKVTVLTIQHTGRSQNELPGIELAGHLARHGLAVTTARTVRDASIQNADVLLSYASDTGADLLVVGGYGHSRAREVLLGGVTRSLLDHMTLPVLMSR